MDSGLRHDLSDPLAMVSMLASTIKEFGGSLDLDRMQSFKLQILAELGRAEELLGRHVPNLDTKGLSEAVIAFVAAPTDPEAEPKLQSKCRELIALLERKSNAN